MEVVVEDDWKMTVAKTPIMRPTNGFLMISDSEKILPPSFPKRISAAEVKKLNEQIKK
jgi:hypothetical protein